VILCMKIVYESSSEASEELSPKTYKIMFSDFSMVY